MDKWPCVVRTDGTGGGRGGSVEASESWVHRFPTFPSVPWHSVDNVAQHDTDEIKRKLCIATRQHLMATTSSTGTW